MHIQSLRICNMSHQSIYWSISWGDSVVLTKYTQYPFSSPSSHHLTVSSVQFLYTNNPLDEDLWYCIVLAIEQPRHVYAPRDSGFLKIKVKIIYLFFFWYLFKGQVVHNCKRCCKLHEKLNEPEHLKYIFQQSLDVSHPLLVKDEQLQVQGDAWANMLHEQIYIS